MEAKKKKVPKVAKVAAPQKKPEAPVRNQQRLKTRDELIAEHMGMIQAIAANIVGAGKIPPGMSFNDLVSFGVEGLVKGYEKFDAGRGVDFKVYSSYRIRGEMLDRIRTEWRYRNPGSYKSYQNQLKEKVAQIAADSAEEGKGKPANMQEQGKQLQNLMANTAMAYLLSTDDFQIQSEMEGAKDPAHEVIESMSFDQERKVLWEEIATLPEDERKIVQLFYVENKSQKDISDLLGFSKSKISRLHLQILHKLRLRMNRKL
jgi:RNA polymerase sigma factor for flagellar operon FliA